MINKATRWAKRERVNVESDLEFNGTNQNVLSGQDLTVSGDFSVSIIEERNVINTNNMIFSIGDGNSEYLTIRTGASGTVSPIGVFFVSGGYVINATNKLPVEPGVGTNQEWINYKSNIIINFIQSQTKIECIINNKKVWEHIDPNFSGLSITGNLRIGGWHNAGNGFNGLISQTSLHTKALTPQEISYIHTQGGLLPESAHESCIAHYPLTQRQYPKASADFIVKHPQFALNDLVAFDVVEQYNYAKVTALTANHGELMNFTDAEVFNANKTSVKDFYLKRISTGKGLWLLVKTSIDPEWGNRLGRCRIIDISPSIVAGSSFSVLLKNSIIKEPTGSNVSLFELGSVTLYIHGTELRIREGITITTLFVLSSNITSSLLASLSYDENTNIYTIKVLNTEVLYETTHLGLGWDFSTQNAFGIGRNAVIGPARGIIWYNCLLFDSIKSNSELKQWVLGNFNYSGTPILDWIFNYERGDVSNGMTIIDQSGNSNDGTLTMAYQGYNHQIEYKSLLPPLNQAFKMDRTFFITTPTSVGDSIANNACSILIRYKTDESAIIADGIQIIAQFQGSLILASYFIADGKSKRINGSDYADEDFKLHTEITTSEAYSVSPFTKQLNVDSKINRVNTNFSQVRDYTGSSFVLRGLNGGNNIQFITLGIWDRILTDKECLELGNNTSFKNPTIEQQQGMICYYNINESSFSENGSDVLLNDYSTNGNHAIITGLAGATSADRLLDVQNHLVDIDELR